MKRFISVTATLVVLLLAGMACTPVPPTCADTLNVTTTLDVNDGACTADHCSLREAVIASNVCAGVQTILVPGGNYPLTILGNEEDASATGDLDITDDLIMQGVGAPSIDGVSEDRILDIFNPAVVSIDQFIFMNGLAQLGGAIQSQGVTTITSSSIHNNVAEVPPGGSGASSGGGIFVGFGSTTISGTDIFENYADVGGGVHNFATAEFTMIGGHLVGNIASAWGGGLWNNMAATANLQDVEVSRNTAPGQGAGIYNNGVLNASLVTFNENMDALHGGGVYNDDNGEMYITLSWFTNNNAQFGGALYNRGLLHLVQTSLTNNSALGGQGGGAFNDGASAALLIRNTTISGNMIVPFDHPAGSGVYNNGGDVRFEFSTLAYNNADGVGNNGGTVAFRSTILAYHALGNCSGVTTGSEGYNLEDGTTCAFDEPSDLISTDPFLLWLDTNGGVNLSHALSPSSPAVDSGDPDRCIEVDQRGVARPQGVLCDRGAIEITLASPTPAAYHMALAIVNANCRQGPATAYESMAMLDQGQSYLVNGRDPLGNWWRVVLPNGLFCWVADSLVTNTPPTGEIGIIDVPPLPTDTPTPVQGCWIGTRCVYPCPPNPKPGGACTP